MKTIFCDWGTTNLRVYLLEYSKVIDTFSSDNGLKKAKEIGFQNILENALTYFKLPAETPVRLSGMVGSKHGWKEAPYAETPVTIDSLSDNFVEIPNFPDVKILGGVCHQMKDGKRDVMRGEEVQIFGILEKYPMAKTICLPGTHAKWVECKDESIQSFSTWMTGDFFRSLSENTIFKEQISNTDFIKDALLKGLLVAKEAGPILNSIFHLRTDYLFAKVSSEEFHSYLSGFIIGSEVKEASKGAQEVYLCGSDRMIELYSLALGTFSKKVIEVPASEATVLGMSRICEGRVCG